MKIEGIIWLRDVVDKLAFKHNVETYEVEEVFYDRPRFHLAERGKREDEDVYLVMGQTDAGRYLSIFFIYKRTKEALILSARDMVQKERAYYGRR